MFSINKFISCGRCKEGYLYRKNDFGEDFVMPCWCLKEYETTELLKIKLYRAGVSSDIINYNIDSYVGEKSKEFIEKLKNYIIKFESFKSCNLYLWSVQNSTQKTTIAKWLISSLISSGYNCQFVLMDTLIKNLQKINFESDETEEIKNEINKYYDVDFLVIDDSFDPLKVTLYNSKYQLPFLDSFLRERLERYKRATCFTSNIPISDIGKNFGISIEKLIERNILLPMEFKDYVYEKNKDKLKDLW